MILLVDNYDSFTYNIAQALGAMGRELTVLRNDVVEVDALADMPLEAIIISPGPGRPEDAGISCAVIERFAGQVPILGVCLGHQAIGLVFGAKVERASEPVHGKCSEVIHDGQGIYKNVPNPLVATRYHSLLVPESSVAPPLTVSARTETGEVMGLRCPNLAVEGVQFHPESIATPQGNLIFSNFLDLYLGDKTGAAAELDQRAAAGR